MKFKYYISILILSGIFSIGNLSAQVFLGAVMGGMNMSQVDGDEVYGYHRFGGTLGAAAILPINNFDLTLETNFVQKGAYQKAIYDSDSITGEYSLRLNYVEIPLMVHYTDKNFISAGIGFSFARLVQAKEIEHGGYQDPYMDTVPFDNNEWNFLADVQIRVWKRLKFNVRFSYSLFPIREREYHPSWSDESWTRKQYNNLWTFRLVYVFNEANYERIKSD